MSTFHLYLKAVAILILVDLFWLGTAGIFGRTMMERIQGAPLQIRYMAGLLVYIFAAYLLLATRSYKEAFMTGAAVYGVYEFTNFTVFEQWDWKFAVADTMWGGVLFVVARYMLSRVF
jgi:uncharacterized membrane protein